MKFPKTARILNAKDFNLVKKEGKRLRLGGVILSWRLTGIRRLGIVVSGRVGNAVQRNRIKRVIREFFRCNMEFFPKGDCVVIPSAETGRMDNDEIRKVLLRALEKIEKD